MRSRYVAYARKDLEYVLATTDPQHRVEVPVAQVRAWMDEAEFTGLEVVRASENGTKGVVEFIARFTTPAGPQTHHEISRFRKDKGRWFFRAGKIVQS
jgi:SEC-C motif-containing protein